MTTFWSALLPDNGAGKKGAFEKKVPLRHSRIQCLGEIARGGMLSRSDDHDRASNLDCRGHRARRASESRQKLVCN